MEKIKAKMCENYSNNLIETGRFIKNNEELNGVYTKYGLSSNLTLKERQNAIINYVKGEFKGECKHMPLTKDQIIGIKKLTRFLLGNKKYFGFYGYAGTGKTTTVIRYLIFMLKRGYLSKITLTSTTNLSLLVMERIFNNYVKDLYFYVTKTKPREDQHERTLIKDLENYGIKIEFKTLHQLLGLSPKYSTKGNLNFTSSGEKIKDFRNKDLKKSDVVVVDECSMISVAVLDNLFLNVKYCDTDSKIMFTGDCQQLPPVEEEDSMVFRNRELNFKTFEKIIEKNETLKEPKMFYNNLKERKKMFMKEIKKIDTFTLKKITRTRNDKIQEVSNCIREWINDNDAIEKLEDNVDNENVIVENKKEKILETDWLKDYLKMVSTKKEAVIITWTNKTSDNYNEIIRSELYGNRKKESFLNGEITILRDNYSAKTYENGNAEIINIYTSEQIRLISVKKERYIYPKITLDIKAKEFNETIDKIKNRINEIFEGVVLNCYEFQAERCSQPDQRFNGKTLNYKGFKQVNDMFQTCKSFIEELINKIKTSDEKDNKINQTITKLWQQINNYIYGNFAKLTYGYAITCHKAQGSSYKNVYIDVEDILKNYKIIEGRKCLYTAVTRTVDKLYLLIPQ